MQILYLRFIMQVLYMASVIPVCVLQSFPIWVNIIKAQQCFWEA